MIELPTILFGPQTAGRGYQMLASAALAPLEPDPADQLRSIPLVLGGWADQGETAFVACFPLGELGFPAVLLRARFVGEASGGTVAYAHGVLVDEIQGAALPGPIETLLDLIPIPDGRNAFASAPLKVPRLAPYPDTGDRWQGLGLAWQDRVIVVPNAADAEPVLRSVLAGITPVQQRPRIRGWATTASLAPTGPFSPARAFQLIVIGDSQTRAPGHYLEARTTATGFTGATVDPPAAWRAWQDFVELTKSDEELAAVFGRIAWTPRSAAVKPADLIALATRTALSGLAGRATAQMRLMLAMARDRGQWAFTEAARQAALHQVETAPLTDAAGFLMAWLKLPAKDRALLGPLDETLAHRVDLATLDGPMLEALIDHGFTDALAALVAAGDSPVIQLDDDAIEHLLGTLVEMPQWGGSHAVLASILLRRISTAGGLDHDAAASGYFAVGLGRCFDWTDVPAVAANLRSPATIVAMRHIAANLSGRYAARLLRLNAAVAAADPVQIDVVEAALAWVRGTAHGPM